MRFAFQVCADLGIDDPVAWFNSVDSAVLDRWLAWYWIKSDSNEEKKMVPPEQALKQLQARAV